MTKRTIAVLLFAVLASAMVLCESKEEKNEISINLGGTLIAGIQQLLVPPQLGWHMPFDISYERVIDSHWVFSTTVETDFKWERIGSTDWHYHLNVAPWVEMDWHPHLASQGLEGFFVGPAVCIPIDADFYTYASPAQGTSVIVAVGASIGYQFLLPFGLDVDVIARWALVGIPVLKQRPVWDQYGFVFLTAETDAAITLGYRF